LARSKKQDTITFIYDDEPYNEFFSEKAWLKSRWNCGKATIEALNYTQNMQQSK
jgi:hypothetical protein